jgi:hypothetical protein
MKTILEQGTPTVKAQRRKVVFRRIRGRIVPITVQDQPVRTLPVDPLPIKAITKASAAILGVSAAGAYLIKRQAEVKAFGPAQAARIRRFRRTKIIRGAVDLGVKAPIKAGKFILKNPKAAIAGGVIAGGAGIALAVREAIRKLDI